MCHSLRRCATKKEKKADSCWTFRSIIKRILVLLSPQSRVGCARTGKTILIYVEVRTKSESFQSHKRENVVAAIDPYRYRYTIPEIKDLVEKWAVGSQIHFPAENTN